MWMPARDAASGEYARSQDVCKVCADLTKGLRRSIFDVTAFFVPCRKRVLPQVLRRLVPPRDAWTVDGERPAVACAVVPQAPHSFLWITAYLGGIGAGEVGLRIDDIGYVQARDPTTLRKWP